MWPYYGLPISYQIATSVVGLILEVGPRSAANLGRRFTHVERSGRTFSGESVPASPAGDTAAHVCREIDREQLAVNLEEHPLVVGVFLDPPHRPLVAAIGVERELECFLGADGTLFGCALLPSRILVGLNEGHLCYSVLF